MQHDVGEAAHRTLPCAVSCSQLFLREDFLEERLHLGPRLLVGVGVIGERQFELLAEFVRALTGEGVLGRPDSR